MHDTISPRPEIDDLDCGSCGVPGCPYCGREPDTVGLVAAYLPGGCLYGAAPAGIGANNPEFWVGLRANPPQPFALVELLNVPRDIASRLTAQGTDEPAFTTGRLAAEAASPFLANRIYTSPRYPDASATEMDPAPDSSTC